MQLLQILLASKQLSPRLLVLLAYLKRRQSPNFSIASLLTLLVPPSHLFFLPQSAEVTHSSRILHLVTLPKLRLIHTSNPSSRYSLLSGTDLLCSSLQSIKSSAHCHLIISPIPVLFYSHWLPPTLPALLYHFPFSLSSSHVWCLCLTSPLWSCQSVKLLPSII